jgi:hypothetical protein
VQCLKFRIFYPSVCFYEHLKIKIYKTLILPVVFCRYKLENTALRRAFVRAGGHRGTVKFGMRVKLNTLCIFYFKFNFVVAIVIESSSVGTVARLRAGFLGFDSRKDRFFSSAPGADRLSGPPSRLSSGYKGSFPGG